MFVLLKTLVYRSWRVFFFQAKAIAEPFAFEEYRKKRIQDKIDEERVNRVKLKVCGWFQS